MVGSVVPTGPGIDAPGRGACAALPAAKGEGEATESGSSGSDVREFHGQRRSHESAQRSADADHGRQTHPPSVCSHDSGGGALGATSFASQLVTRAAAQPATYNEAPMLAELVQAGSAAAGRGAPAAEPLVVTPKSGRHLRRHILRRGDGAGDHQRFSGRDGDRPLPLLERPLRDLPGSRYRLRVQRRLHQLHDHPAPGHQVVGRRAVHRQRHDVLLRGLAVRHGAAARRSPASGSSAASPSASRGRRLHGRIHLRRTEPGLQPGQLLRRHRPSRGGHATTWNSSTSSTTRTPQTAATAAGYDSWQLYFLRAGAAATTYNYGAQNPEMPVLGPWRPVSNDTQRQQYERNPYYFKVDTEGNQLPYVDNVTIDYAGDPEVMNLRAISGELSVAGLDLQLINYPVIRDGEEGGDYTTTLVYSERGSDVALAFNQNHPDPVLYELFRRCPVPPGDVAGDQPRRDQRDRLPRPGHDPPGDDQRDGQLLQAGMGRPLRRVRPGRGEQPARRAGAGPARRRGVPPALRRPAASLSSWSTCRRKARRRKSASWSSATGPSSASQVAAGRPRAQLPARAARRRRAGRAPAGTSIASWSGPPTPTGRRRSSAQAAIRSSATPRPGGDWFASGGKTASSRRRRRRSWPPPSTSGSRPVMGTPEFTEARHHGPRMVAEAALRDRRDRPGAAAGRSSRTTSRTSSPGAEERIWWGAANWFWHTHNPEQWFLTS